MRTRLLLALFVIAMIPVPTLPQAHAASGTYFDHIVILAMENQDYSSVLGNGTPSGCPSGTAPFLCSMLSSSSTIPNYHSYCSGSSDPACTSGISGCSAACYTAVTSGNTYGVSDGVGQGSVSVTNIFDGLSSAGLSWTEFCESGCPRGPDHSPCLQYADTANSPNCIVLSGGLIGDSQVLSSTSNYVWITPTDNHNMHDNSISSGDSWVQSFLVGSGSLASPASGSLLASGLFTNPSFHTLLWIWWDEYDPSPNLQYGPMANKGFISSSNSWDEYSTLRIIENNWGLSTLVNDAQAPVLTELFGSSPPVLRTSFTTSPATPLVNVPVTFTATTTGGTAPYSVSWTFGDGATGTGASITHVYVSVGSYIVTETATDASSPSQRATSSQTVAITGPVPLTTGFTFLPSNPIINSPVTFTATSTGGIAPYTVKWNFGDGATSTGATATHTYTTAQSFTVTENATDSSSPVQTASSSTTVVVTPPPPPSTSFTVQPSTPVVNTPITFSTTTTGGTAPYTIAWNFGDGTTGTGAATTHTYTTTGTFTVRENATDSSTPTQTATYTQSLTIYAVLPLSTTFSVSTPSPRVGQTVTFSATATGGTPPYTYAVDFGDGSTSTGNSVSYAYSAPGSYTAMLTVTDSASPQASISQSLTINVQALVPPTLTVLVNQTVTAGTWINFTIAATSANGGTITFSATSLPAGASLDPTTGAFSWKPSASQTGSYTIVFIATDSNDPSAPTSKPMGILVNQAAPGGSNGGSGGSGGSSNGGCLLCGLPKISTNVGLLIIGGLLGVVASLALLTIRARASLERTKRRMKRPNRQTQWS